MWPPIGPHICFNQTAPRANHAPAQRPHRHIIGQRIRVHNGVVIAARGLAIDQHVAAAVPAYVPERDGRECLALRWGHVTAASLAAPWPSLALEGQHSVLIHSYRGEFRGDNSGKSLP